jgi:hypothetical protein
MQDESGHASADFVHRLLTNLAGARMEQLAGPEPSHAKTAIFEKL